MANEPKKKEAKATKTKNRNFKRKVIRTIFDMEALQKERKTAQPHSDNGKDHSLKTPINVSGAPRGLSRFRTRVIVNEVLAGTPNHEAIAKALAITSRKED